MASNLPASCCTIGVKHEGEPAGQIIKLGSIDVYVAEPKGDTIHKHVAIIYIPDVIGIWKNSQLIADQFAANGYYTIIPDIYNGDALPLNMKWTEDFDFMKWMMKGTGGANPHTVEGVEPIVQTGLEFLKSKGFTKIGSAGYCFGAKYVCRFLAEGKGIDVGFIAHPSFVDEEELAAIKGPLTIAAAETDQIFPSEKRHKSEQILVKTGQPYQINLYSGVVHGFSVRCDTSQKIEKFAKEKAFLQAVHWFDEHLL